MIILFSSNFFELIRMALHYYKINFRRHLLLFTESVNIFHYLQKYPAIFRAGHSIYEKGQQETTS